MTSARERELLGLPTRELLSALRRNPSNAHYTSRGNFVSLHHRASPSFLLLKPSSLHSLHQDDAVLTHSSNLDLDPLVDWQDEGTIVAVYEGLICLLTNTSILICNPAVRRVHDAGPPRERAARANHFYYNTYGFGKNYMNDYKMIEIEAKIGLRGRIDVTRPPRARIYSVRDRNWRDIQAPLCSICSFGYFAHNGVVVDDIVHWGARRRLGDGSWYTFILTFNFDHETFGEIDLPHSLAHSSSESAASVYVIPSGHMKPLTACSVDPEPFTHWGASAIWTMSQNLTWTQLISFNYREDSISLPVIGIDPGLILVRTCPMALCHRNNGEVLFSMTVLDDQQSLYSLNIPNRSFTRLPIEIDIDGQIGQGYTGYYSESIALLHGNSSETY